MRLKKEYLILVLLIIILGIYLWKHNADRINYDLPKLEKIDTQSISRIVLDKSGRNSTLKQDKDKWYIGKKDFRADGKKVQKILSTINKPELNTLISRSKNYNRYKLKKSQGLAVKAFDDKGNLLRGINIGKRSSTYNNNYIKLHEDPNVYLAKTSLNRDFNISADELRDKTVLEFSREKIKSITVQNSKQVKARKRTEKSGDAQKEITHWQDGSGERLDKDKIDDLLAELRSLECNSFYPKDLKKEMTSFDFKVILKSEKEHFLQLYVEDQGEEKSYSGISSQVKYPFELEKYKGKKIRDALKALLP